MAIITAEAEGVAEVTIDAKQCNACGLCVQVCCGAPLRLHEGRIIVDQSRLFGCVGCGMCMVVCPRNAIQVAGRGISPRDVDNLPALAPHADYLELVTLMEGRRSCRWFFPADVSPRHVQQILEAAATAPVRVPPSGVGVLVRQGGHSVQLLRRDLLEVIRRRRWIFRPPAVWALRPFMTRARWLLLQSLVGPAFDAYLDESPEQPPDVDSFFYHAPLALYFYSSETSDLADAPIAATHAMLAAESLGYGTCFIGFPGWVFALDRKVRARYALPEHAHPGLTLLVGRAHVRPKRWIHRRFARLDWDNAQPAEPTPRD
jgi:nitroreductase/Pyruvate/2-oxoacid:ferredoxin oxidoreductase delta subunit